MGWKPGESGNPNGRPKKGFGLTDILSRAGSKSVQIAGKGMARKRLVAQLVWQATTEGFVEFPDGRREKIDASTWLSLVKWLYSRIDGMPPQAIDLSGSLQTVNITSDELAQARAELEEWQQERFGDEEANDE